MTQNIIMPLCITSMQERVYTDDDGEQELTVSLYLRKGTAETPPFVQALRDFANKISYNLGMEKGMPCRVMYVTA